MGQKRQDENAVVYAVNQVCGLYGVNVIREQSRVFSVIGKSGRERPMFIGQWTDANGQPHYAGKADLLARPKVLISRLLPAGAVVPYDNEQERQLAMGVLAGRTAVPLWIETKAKGNRLSAEQEAFRHFVTGNLEHHIVVAEDVRPLMEWFDKMGVKR